MISSKANLATLPKNVTKTRRVNSEYQTPRQTLLQNSQVLKQYQNSQKLFNTRRVQKKSILAGFKIFEILAWNFFTILAWKKFSNTRMKFLLKVAWKLVIYSHEKFEQTRIEFLILACKNLLWNSHNKNWKLV